jgi:hypothetical protein
MNIFEKCIHIVKLCSKHVKKLAENFKFVKTVTLSYRSFCLGRFLRKIYNML